MIQTIKRKTVTSTAVKSKYNSKHYTAITIRLDKDLVEQFKEKTQKENISQAEVFKAAIIEFLKK